MQIADNIEMWRLINGYDNYEVSSHGRVKNNQTISTAVISELSKPFFGISKVIPQQLQITVFTSFFVITFSTSS